MNQSKLFLLVVAATGVVIGGCKHKAVDRLTGKEETASPTVVAGVPLVGTVSAAAVATSTGPIPAPLQALIAAMKIDEDGMNAITPKILSQAASIAGDPVHARKYLLVAQDLLTQCQTLLWNAQDQLRRAQQPPIDPHYGDVVKAYNVVAAAYNAVAKAYNVVAQAYTAAAGTFEIDITAPTLKDLTAKLSRVGRIVDLKMSLAVMNHPEIVLPSIQADQTIKLIKKAADLGNSPILFNMTATLDNGDGTTVAPSVPVTIRYPAGGDTLTINILVGGVIFGDGTVTINLYPSGFLS